MPETYYIPQLIQAISNNRNAYLSCIVGSVPGMQLLREAEFCLINSNLKLPTFNSIVACHFQENNIEQKIDFILDYFQSKNLPFMWWVDEYADPENLEDYLLARGLEGYEHDVGMFLQLDEFFPSTEKTILQFQQIKTEQEFLIFVELTAKVFLVTDADFFKFYQQAQQAFLHNDAVSIYLAYYQQQAVAACLSFQHDQVIGLYNIGVLPEYRSRGFARALIEHVLSQAKPVCQLAVLQASDEGLGLYQRLGFREVCQFAVFQSP